MISTSDGETYEDATAHALGVEKLKAMTTAQGAAESAAERTKSSVQSYSKAGAKWDSLPQKEPPLLIEGMPGSTITEPINQRPSFKNVSDLSESKKLYIIRHGSTDMNKDGDTSADRIRGWKDVPLNDEGRQDAEKAGQKLAQMESPTVMHHSDLDRASETAGIISKHIDTPLTPSRNLRPWDLGELTGKSTKEAIPQIEDYVKNNPDQAVPKGESFNEFKDRAFKGIHAALDSGDSPVAIVTHHRLERLLEAWNAKGQPDDHSIDLDTFTQKGDPPGGIKEMDIKSMTHEKAETPLSGKNAPEPARTINAIIDHYKNAIMSGPDLMKDFMEGKTSSEDPNVGIRGLGVAASATSTLSPFAQRGALGAFGGRLAPLAEVAAESLEAKGKGALAIKAITGLERGAEGKWRKEISDYPAEVNLKREPTFPPEDAAMLERKRLENLGLGGLSGPVDPPTGWSSIEATPKPGRLVEGTYNLGDIYKHPELYKDYPELKKMPIHVENAGKGNWHGTYMYHEHDPNYISNIRLNSVSEMDPKVILAHEIQHYIQHKEGFSIGDPGKIVHDDVLEGYKARLLRKYNRKDIQEAFSNPDEEAGRRKALDILAYSDYLVYRGLAHESEAHAVGDRINIPPKDIRKSLGSSSEQIERKDQLLLDRKRNKYGIGEDYPRNR